MQIKGIRATGDQYKDIRPWRALEFFNATIAEDPDEPDVGIISLGVDSFGRSVEFYGAVGDGVTDDGPALQDAFDVGGFIFLPGRNFKSNQEIIPTKSFYLLGATLGFVGLTPQSCITFASGLSGFTLNNATAPFSRIQNTRLKSLSVGSGAGTGVNIRAHGTVLDGVQIDGFGDDGIAIDTLVSGNANNCHIGTVRCSDNGRHGLYFDGVDSNLCKVINYEATANGGWGVWIETASVYGTVFLSPNIDGNLTGAVHDDGTGTRWISPDIEPTGDDSVELEGPFILWDADGRTSPPITRTNSNMVLRGGIPRMRMPLVNDDFTNQFAWTSGVFEASSLGLVDDTNAVNILHYRPSTNRFTHLTPTHHVGLYQSVVAQPFHASTMSFDVRTGNVFTVAMSANVTATAFTATNVVGCPIVTIAFVQGAGGHTYVFPSNCRFAGGSAPSDTTASTSTSVTFRFDAGASKWYEISRAVAVPV